MYKVPYSPRGGGKFIKQFGEEYQIGRRAGKRGRGKGRENCLGKNIKLVEGKGKGKCERKSER